MKKLFAFIISSVLLMSASSVSTSTGEEIRKITQDTPLILQHFNSSFDNDSEFTTETGWHYSHSSHASHSSHQSHYSHRSGY